MLLQTTGQWREAVSAYSTVLSLDTQNVDAFCEQRDLQAPVGRFFSALDHIDTAVRLQPEASFVLNIKGSIEQVIGYTEKAQRCYQRAAELDPDNYPARRQLLVQPAEPSH